MAEEKSESAATKNPDDTALEMMKFIAVTTGYGKGIPSAGFGGKEKVGRSAEEYAEALLDLFERCRSVVVKSPK
jgi:ATP:corrinoid adenosyltransferase